MTTSVPVPTIDATGVNAPSTAGIYAGVMADFSGAFNSPAMSVDQESPQGQFGTSISETLQAYIDVLMTIVSGVDPATSSGRLQDGIGRFFGMQRIAASSTTVTVTCGGATGTPIPVGSLAKTQGNDIYQCVSGGEIGASGTIDLEFQNTATGPVACPAGYLSQIYQAIPGWDTVTNAADGTPGTAVETPQAYEVRRQAELALPGQGYNAAVKALLLDPNVGAGAIDAYVYDNSSANPLTYRGVTIPAGQMYACVYGGTDAAVAAAIWTKKGQGTPMYAVNPVNVVYEDTSNGYQTPYPSYTITFDRPVTLLVAVAVQLSSLETVPDDYVSQIQTVVSEVFAGTDVTGLGAPRLGSRLLASRFQAPLAAMGAWSQVVSIKVGCANDPDAAQFTASIGAGGTASNVMAVTAVSAGTLAIGQFVLDSAGAVIVGTVITGQTSGTTGGVGNYTVSSPQLVASRGMSAFTADQDFVDLNLNQLAGANAALTTGGLT